MTLAPAGGEMFAVRVDAHSGEVVWAEPLTSPLSGVE